MRAVNIMNFVRSHEPRIKDYDSVLLETTKQEIALVKEYGVENTFLLQYDALINPNYIDLFKKEKDDKMELGLWLEIVKPLCDKVGLPWRSEKGWAWDWHVVPGFSMAYTPKERELLIDEAMRAFKEIFGFYPKTIGSWLIDTHTANYVAENYEIDALCICRDQVNTDAYTLVGGYFNNMYYPSKNNIFTPAQTAENQVNVPVIRLLTSDPIHTYDRDKFIPDEKKETCQGCYTLEPGWTSGRDKDIVNWYFKTYFENENLGFSYVHIGQENSFGHTKIMKPLRQQLDLLKAYPGVSVMKMCDTGKYIKSHYTSTSSTIAYADDDWVEGENIQSVYYNSKRYTANLFRHKNRIFIRSLYLFDETVKEHYFDTPCQTWNATYENLPVIDTVIWDEKNAADCGMTLDFDGCKFTVNKISENEMEAVWNNKKVIFRENGLEFVNCDATINWGEPTADIKVTEKAISYCYNNKNYSVSLASGNAENTNITAENGIISMIF